MGFVLGVLGLEFGVVSLAVDYGVPAHVLYIIPFTSS